MKNNHKSCFYIRLLFFFFFKWKIICQLIYMIFILLLQKNMVGRLQEPLNKATTDTEIWFNNFHFSDRSFSLLFLLPSPLPSSSLCTVLICFQFARAQDSSGSLCRFAGMSADRGKPGLHLNTYQAASRPLINANSAK